MAGAKRNGSGARPLFAYIDCVRGYAVTMVVSCHLAYAFAELPDPVHRIVALGWYGVQLFFLASALTLLMSWHYESDRLRVARVIPFFIRRFFRIAPAYYAAAGFYALLTPPPGGFDGGQLVTSLAFLNGWSPARMPTVSGGWYVVPGGWSIAVEFTFYLLFPLFATWVTGVRRGLLVFGLCWAVGLVANRIAAPLLGQSYTPVAIDNFLYFWFPNQMAVFALGGVLYFVQQRLGTPPARRIAVVLRSHGGLIAAAAMVLVFATAYVRLPHYLDASRFLPPGFLVVSLFLAVFILALSQVRRSLLLTPVAAAIGKVSFSAYLLHFAVIEIAKSHPVLFHTDAQGMAAVAAFSVTWLVVMVLTFAGAWCTYQALELPMIAIGRNIVRARWRVAAQLH